MTTSAAHLNPPIARTTWLRLAKDYPVVPSQEAEAIWDDFGGEMQQYCELIAGAKGNPVGLMFRGQGQSFTDRVDRWADAWNVPAADRGQLTALAERYAHTNAFLKLGWKAGAARLLEVSYRRRPPVRRVLHDFFVQGVDKECLQRILWLSRVLQKETVHFVGAAHQSGEELSYKLSFSQFITAESYARVVARILAILEHFSIVPTHQNSFLQFHPQLCPPDREGTIFLSFSFTPHGLHPHFQIDYPQVSPRSIQQVMGPPAVRPTLYEDLCQKAGLDDLSYLGWRFHTDAPPSFNFYADIYQPT